MAQRKSKPSVSTTFVLALLGASLSPLVGGVARAQTAPAFEGLAGKWAGDGSIALTSGATERLRCDATYTVSGGGDNLDQSLQCASDSYHFDLRISLVDKAGAILGNWNELSKQVQGGIAGQNAKGLIKVMVRGQNFTAAVVVATHGGEQTVSIHADSGDLSQVSIALHHAR